MLILKNIPFVNFLSSYFLVNQIFKENKTILKLLPPFFYKRYRFESRVFSGGLHFFLSRGTQHPLGPEKTPEIKWFHWPLFEIHIVRKIITFSLTRALPKFPFTDVNLYNCVRGGTRYEKKSTKFWFFQSKLWL